MSRISSSWMWWRREISGWYPKSFKVQHTIPGGFLPFWSLPFWVQKVLIGCSQWSLIRSYCLFTIFSGLFQYYLIFLQNNFITSWQRMKLPTLPKMKIINGKAKNGIWAFWFELLKEFNIQLFLRIVAILLTWRASNLRTPRTGTKPKSYRHG